MCVCDGDGGRYIEWDGMGIDVMLEMVEAQGGAWEGLAGGDLRTSLAFFVISFYSLFTRYKQAVCSKSYGLKDVTRFVHWYMWEL